MSAAVKLGGRVPAVGELAAGAQGDVVTGVRLGLAWPAAQTLFASRGTV
jgi:hypothetical protein